MNITTAINTIEPHTVKELYDRVPLLCAATLNPELEELQFWTQVDYLEELVSVPLLQLEIKELRGLIELNKMAILQITKKELNLSRLIS